MTRQEKGKTDKVEEFLKSRGYTTMREVNPIECANWEHPYAVDLIFYKNPENAIGVEFKDASIRSGGKIAKAFSQIQKYKPLHFKGVTITKWCICPTFEKPETMYTYYEPYNNNHILPENIERQKAYQSGVSFAGTVVMDFVQKFFNYFDIGYFWSDGTEIIIDSFTSHKINIK